MSSSDIMSGNVYGFGGQNRNAFSIQSLNIEGVSEVPVHQMESSELDTPSPSLSEQSSPLQSPAFVTPEPPQQAKMEHYVPETYISTSNESSPETQPQAWQPWNQQQQQHQRLHQQQPHHLHQQYSFDPQAAYHQYYSYIPTQARQSPETYQEVPVSQFPYSSGSVSQTAYPYYAQSEQSSPTSSLSYQYPSKPSPPTYDQHLSTSTQPNYPLPRARIESHDSGYPSSNTSSPPSSPASVFTDQQNDQVFAPSEEQPQKVSPPSSNFQPYAQQYNQTYPHPYPQMPVGQAPYNQYSQYQDLPAINLAGNQYFTEAEIKSITPWRNQLLRRLLDNRTVYPETTDSSTEENAGDPMAKRFRSIAPKPNEYTSVHQLENHSVKRSSTSNNMPSRNHSMKQETNTPRDRSKPFFHSIGHLTELDFGSSPGYHGRLERYSSGYSAITRAMGLASQGTVTLRSVVEVILKSTLDQDLAQYSLTGRSLSEKLEIRNGQQTTRVVMSESGTSKLSIPATLIAAITTFLSETLVDPEAAIAPTKNMSSWVRKMVSKTCSRCQEKRNHEIRSVAIRNKK